MGGEAQSGIDKYIYSWCKQNMSCGVNPNIITLVGLMLIIPILFLLQKQCLWGAVILLLFRCILDILDGCVARKCNKVSKFGAKFDEISDIVFHGILAMYIVYNIHDKSINTTPIRKVTLFLILMVLGFWASRTEFFGNNTILLYIIESFLLIIFLSQQNTNTVPIITVLVLIVGLAQICGNQLVNRTNI